jgi:hypothetical protein
VHDLLYQYCNIAFCFWALIKYHAWAILYPHFPHFLVISVPLWKRIRLGHDSVLIRHSEYFHDMYRYAEGRRDQSSFSVLPDASKFEIHFLVCHFYSGLVIWFLSLLSLEWLLLLQVSKNAVCSEYIVTRMSDYIWVWNSVSLVNGGTQTEGVENI